MARTSSNPFDGQSIIEVTLDIPKVDMTANYAVTSDAAGRTEITNVSSGIDMTEKVTFNYQQTTPNNFDVNPVYPKTTKSGFKVSITDAFVRRTVNDDGTINDDPMKVWFSIEAPKGANLASGDDLYTLCLSRILAFAMMQTGETPDDSFLDRLMRGATKPASLV